MVTWAWGNSFCTAMAITWLIEWRMRSSCSLSLVLGRVIAAGSGLLVVTGTNRAAQQGDLESYAALLGWPDGI